MQSAKELNKRLVKILEDERFWYRPADVQTNAPLALVQVEMRSEFRALCWVLELSPVGVRDNWGRFNRSQPTPVEEE